MSTLSRIPSDDEPEEAGHTFATNFELKDPNLQEPWLNLNQEIAESTGGESQLEVLFENEHFLCHIAVPHMQLVMSHVDLVVLSANVRAVWDTWLKTSPCTGPVEVAQA